jgi:methylmalonyl-CoA/ethylmalonyl-CoA epimerase
VAAGEKVHTRAEGVLNVGLVQNIRMTTHDETLHISPHTAAGAPVDSIGILRIDHVGVAVADLDEAISFYARVFGMSCAHVEVNEEQGVREAMLRVGEAETGGMIQLLAPLHAGSTIAKFLDTRGPGIQQLAYTVRDIAATSAHLRRQGVRLLYDEPRRGTAGSLVNFVHPKDAGGVLVELVQSSA